MAVPYRVQRSAYSAARPSQDQVLSSGDSADKSRSVPRKRKRVHHKVKTGCAACKVRRQKCSEEKPICTGCVRYSTECVYESRAGLRLETARPCSTSIPSNYFSSHPTKGLPCSPSANLELESLELLHQWLTQTCVASGQLPEITTYVQLNVPPLAQEFPFAMHGILAMAAIHLSYLRPAHRNHYNLLASKHHDQGLPDFRSALERFDVVNHKAVISYSKSILWCSLAIPTTAHPAAATWETKDSWLPQWFYLLRGSCQVVEAARVWIKDGPHALLPLPSSNDFSGSSEDRCLSALMSISEFISASPIFNTSVASLRAAFLRASIDNHNTPLRNGINFWASSMPDEYIQSLQKDEPWALVVLAHFCILIHRLETSDFSQGHALQLMRTLCCRLDRRWHCYIQWPCAEMGLDKLFLG